MTKYIELPVGTVELFAKTLEDRNLLIHRFFRESGFSMVEDAGRAKMVSHLQALAAQLERAYAVASHLLGACDAVPPLRRRL